LPVKEGKTSMLTRSTAILMIKEPWTKMEYLDNFHTW